MRALLLATISILTITACQAQLQPRFKAALVAGANASQIDGDNLAGYHRWGFNGGGRVYAMLNDNLSLSVELLYTQKGSSSTKHELQPDSAVRVTINYAEIPVMFNYHDQDRAIFGVGVSYARMLNYRYEEGGQNTTDDSPPILNKDISFLAEVTFSIWKKFGISARYNYSIASIGYNPKSPLKNHAMYNGVLSFRACYFFN